MIMLQSMPGSTVSFVDMKTVLNYLPAGELWHVKKHLDVIRLAVQPCGSNASYFIRPHLAFIVFSVFYFNHAVDSSDILQTCYTRNSR